MPETTSEAAIKTGDSLKNVLEEAHKLLKEMSAADEGQDRAADLSATLKKLNLNQAWEKGGPGIRAVKIAHEKEAAPSLTRFRSASKTGWRIPQKGIWRFLESTGE